MCAQKSVEPIAAEAVHADPLETSLRNLDCLRDSPQVLQSADCLLLRHAFSSQSAHVRSKAIDVLAWRAGPKLWLGAAHAGELVLWHTQDADARVRDRAFHCLLLWITAPRDVMKPAISKSCKLTVWVELCAALKTERLSWIQSNLDATYASACHGLLDVEEMVRRTSLHLLAQLSLTRPNHLLDDPPPIGLVPLGSQLAKPPKPTEDVRLVDDAFRRVCMRLQDPARQVRQLAAQILADLAKAVTEESLILTLEKTVMSDRQVRCSLLDNRTAIALRKQSDRGRTEPCSSARSTNPSVLNLVATGSSGAIVSGLEDDYFEVRCATLATVTHMASLSTQFAANCQDLLVDMLTDDIQEVRLAAIRALGAVGDQVPLQSEQVAIITSALAEGSGRTRRRLHQLLSRCCLASAPCLISLLDGLLHNLRRYPQDRDSLWRCAASVGRRHSVFVETCLPSLLRTHLWLSGPEPNWEDPAYLTVLLLVLNAEPGAPGMQAQFPRHLAGTKVYLTELVPSLVPKRRNPFDVISISEHVSKRRRIDPVTALSFTEADLREPDGGSTDSLLRFLYTLIRRVVCALNELRGSHADSKHNPNRPIVPSSRGGLVDQRITLLTRLVFTDLCGCVQRLDRTGQWNGLIQWLTVLTTIGWCLACVGAFPGQTGTDTGPHARTEPTVPLVRKTRKLLSRALQMTLRALHLFSGKTDTEQATLTRLAHQLMSLSKLHTLEAGVSNPQLWDDSVQSVIALLSELVCVNASTQDLILQSELGPHSIGLLQKSANRLFPVYVALVQPLCCGLAGLSDLDAFGFGRAPTGATWFTTRLNEDTDDGWAPPSRVADQSASAPPEVRFTATIATVSIRIRAVVVGMGLVMARKRVCLLFRRPDLNARAVSNCQINGDLWTGNFYQWWPPACAWHPLDDGFPTDRKQSDSDVDRVELRTHLELSAGRWSDAGTVEIGLGYCLTRADADSAATRNLGNAAAGADEGDSTETETATVRPWIIIPLTPRKMLARIKLIPSTPISQW